MKRVQVVFAVLAALLLVLTAPTSQPASAGVEAPQSPEAPGQPLRCVAFSPWIEGHDAGDPVKGQILQRNLMEKIIPETGFHCILLYTAYRDFDGMYKPAKDLGIQVIAYIPLDGDPAQDAKAISEGIQTAKMYPNVIRVSCGNEVRVRHRNLAEVEAIIRNCVRQVKAAGVTQPVGTTDSWWDLCSESWQCSGWGLINELDWVGANIQPWLDNQYLCIPTHEAPNYIVDRFLDVKRVYPGKEVIATEFGWPAGPNGYTQGCGVASEANQRMVIQATLTRLNELRLPAVVFEAFREPMLAPMLGPGGPYFGICPGNPGNSLSSTMCSVRYRLERLPRRAFLPMTAFNR